MFIRLLALFILVPLLELALLIEIGQHLGIIWTIVLVGSTGAVGISLARQQGLAVISRLKGSLQKGQLPQDSLLDGVLVLVGAAMLLTPGLITDITGFSLIIPATRKLVRKLVKKKLLDKFEINSHYSYNNFNNTQEFNDNKEDDEEEIIDIEDYEELD